MGPCRVSFWDGIFSVRMEHKSMIQFNRLKPDIYIAIILYTIIILFKFLAVG